MRIVGPAIAGILLASAGEAADGVEAIEQALRLNPNFSLAQGYYGLTLAYCGRWQEAYQAAQRAIRLSPRDPYCPVYYGIAAYAQFIGRNYEADAHLPGVARQLEQASVGEGEAARAVDVVEAGVVEGRLDDAVEALARATSWSPAFSYRRWRRERATGPDA